MPASASIIAACVYGPKTRFTAKPVQLPTTTGVFLICLAKLRQSFTIWGGVVLVRMISSSGITCAGLKKCAPVTKAARQHLTKKPSYL
eukprot:4097442-Pyramimonas_sp.AAC.1